MSKEKSPEIQAAAPVDLSVEPEIPQTVEEMNAEMKLIELRLKRAELAAAEAKLRNAELEQLERQANIEDLKERLDERKVKRADKVAKYRGNGINIAQERRNRDDVQKRCNHKKGGDGAKGVIGGKGSDPQYAVLKHEFANGDTWVRCLRCAKTWKPPIRADFKTQEGYDAAVERYEVAKNFDTRNQTSSSYCFQWGFNAEGKGGAEFFREVTRNVNLE